MIQYNFEERTAVVTGGAQGIGLAVAKRLLAGGARVSLWDADPVALAAAQDALQGQTVHTAQVDVTDLAQVEAAVVQTEAACGPIAIGALHDAVGSWAPALAVCGALCILMVGLGLGAGRDRQLA